MNTDVSIEDLEMVIITIAGVATPDMQKELEMHVNPITKAITYQVHHIGHLSFRTEDIDDAVREYNKITICE